MKYKVQSIKYKVHYYVILFQICDSHHNIFEIVAVYYILQDVKVYN